MRFLFIFATLLFGFLMFDWGHTVGEYRGEKIQASYSKFNCYFGAKDDPASPKNQDQCVKFQSHALHQFEPFPENIEDAIRSFDVNDL